MFFVEGVVFLKIWLELEWLDIQLYFCIVIVDDYVRKLYVGYGFFLYMCMLCLYLCGCVGL